MLLYALKRLAGAIPTLWLLVTLAFFLMRAAPGGPFDSERALPPVIEASLQAQYHLDAPLWDQYLRYLSNLARGDLGPSFQYRYYTVNELIAIVFPVSALLGGLVLALAALLGLAAGLYAGLRRNRPADHIVMATAMTGISIPNFVLAPLLVLGFAIYLHWLPAGGWGLSPAQIVLPVLALALPPVAYLARLTRAALVEVLGSPWIRTARAKGLPSRIIILRHALKPVLLPVVSYLGPAAAGVLTGSVVIEQIFGLPGLGRYFVLGALNRDYTLVLGVVVLYGGRNSLLHLLVHLAFGWPDPKVRVRSEPRPACGPLPGGGWRLIARRGSARPCCWAWVCWW